MRKRKRNRNYITKRFYRTLKYLRKENLFNGYLCTWQDELSGRLRFAILSGLLEAVGRFWKSEEVPVVVELLYTADTICYRNQMRNLVGMFICTITDGKPVDDCTELCANGISVMSAKSDVYTKTTHITFVTLVGLALELKLDNAYSLSEIDWSYYERLKKVVPELRGQNWERYYKQVIEPIAVEIAKDRATSDLFQKGSTEGILACLEWDADLDREVVAFLVEDAWKYVEGCDCFSYNPLWLFGTELYAEVAIRFRGALIKNVI